MKNLELYRTRNSEFWKLFLQMLRFDEGFYRQYRKAD